MNITSTLKNKIQLISIFIILLIIVASAYYFFIKPVAQNNLQVILENNTSEMPVGEILPDMKIRQSFRVQDDFKAFSVMFATYDRKNTGATKVELYSKLTGELLYSNEIQNIELSDNAYQIFEFEKAIQVEPGEEFEICIRAIDSEKENAVTIWKSQNDSYEEGTLTIDGQLQQQDIAFRIYSNQDKSWITALYVIFMIICFIGAILLCYLNFYKQLALEKLFLISALIIGSIYSIILTPNTVPDEAAHFVTAYRWSNVMMFLPYANNDTGTMYQRESDIENIHKMDVTPNQKAMKTMFTLVKEKNTSNKLIEIQERAVAGNIVYIPSAVAITIGRLLQFNTTTVYYLARLFNFITYIILVYYAIKLIPFGKMIIYLAAMLPMSIQQGMSLSYDAITIGVSFLFISFCLRYVYVDIKSKKNKIFLLLLGMLLVSCKSGAYIFICGLLLLLWKKNQKKEERIYVAAFLIICFATVLIQKSLIICSDQGLLNVQYYTINDILKEPINFINILLHTFSELKMFYLTSMLGASLGPADLPINMTLISLFVITLIFSGLKQDEEQAYIGKVQKLWLTLIITLTYIGIEVALMIGWTAYGSNIIAGVQGRYFIPMLPLIILLLRNSFVVLKRSIDRILIFCCYTLQIFTITNLYITVVSR